MVDWSVNDQLEMVWMEGLCIKDYPGIFLDRKLQLGYPAFQLRFEPRTVKYEVADQ